MTHAHCLIERDAFSGFRFACWPEENFAVCLPKHYCDRQTESGWVNEESLEPPARGEALPGRVRVEVLHSPRQGYARVLLPDQGGGFVKVEIPEEALCRE